MRICRCGWWPNTTQMWILATCGREPASRCRASKPSIVSDPARMHIVGQRRPRVVRGDEIHERVVRRANVEFELLAGSHLLEHFHGQLEVGRLAPGSDRLICA